MTPDRVARLRTSIAELRRRGRRASAKETRDLLNALDEALRDNEALAATITDVSVRLWPTDTPATLGERVSRVLRHLGTAVELLHGDRHLVLDEHRRALEALLPKLGPHRPSRGTAALRPRA